MGETAGTELELLGRKAAQQVAGGSSVEQVEVVSGEDQSGEPAYYFSFLIDQGRASQKGGLLYVRLIQELRDELTARGDTHYPYIRILDRTDWDRRKGA
jgi:hypothetical protein